LSIKTFIYTNFWKYLLLSFRKSPYGGIDNSTIWKETCAIDMRTLKTITACRYRPVAPEIHDTQCHFMSVTKSCRSY